MWLELISSTCFICLFVLKEGLSCCMYNKEGGPLNRHQVNVRQLFCVVNQLVSTERILLVRCGEWDTF